MSDNTAGDGGGRIYNFRGPVTVDANALVFDNTAADAQCFNVANCPNPPDGISPVARM